MLKVKKLIVSMYQRHFMRYLLVGGTTFLIDFCLLYFLHGEKGVNLALAATIAYWTSIAYNFALNRFWTFTSIERKRLRENALFYILLLFFNYIFTVLSVSVLSIFMYFTYAKIISVVIQMFWTYYLYKNYVFGSNNRAKKLRKALVRNLKSFGVAKSIVVAGIILAYLVLFFTSFKMHSLNTKNNIDGSWSYALSSLRHHPEQSLGNDTFFTYGPLSVKIMATVHHNDSLSDYLISITLLCIIFLLCLYLVWRSLRNISLLNVLIILGLLLLLLVGEPTVDLLFFATLLIALIGYRPNESIKQQLLLFSGPLVISTYKNNLLITMAVLMLILAVIQQPIKKVFKFLISVSSTYYAILVLLGISLWKVPTFISYSIQDALDYNEFMSLTTNQAYTITFFVALLFFGSIRAVILYTPSIKKILDYPFRSLLLAIAEVWILWVVFKEASTRSDGHVIVFFPFMFYMAARLYPLLYSRYKMLFAGYVWISLSFVVTLWVMTVHVPKLLPIPKRIYAARTFENITFQEVVNLFDYSHFAELRSVSQGGFNGLRNDVSDIRNLLEEYEKQNNKDYEVVGYTNTIFYLPAITEDYRYAPFLQTYQAFPTALFDRLYKEYLTKNPDTLVFWTDINPSVDGRIPTSDLPETFDYIRKNYEVVVSNNEKGLYLYGKSDKEKSIRHEKSCTYVYMNSFTNTPFDVSETTTQLEINVQDDSRFLIDMAYKKPIYKIYLFDDKGREVVYRTTPSLLEHGLDINPFLPKLNSELKSDFKIIKAMVSASDQRESGIDIIQKVCDK